MSRPAASPPNSRASHPFDLTRVLSRLCRQWSAEGVDNGDPLDFPAVGHVLSIERTASEGTGGGNDRAIPIRESVCRLDLQRADEDRERNLLHSETGPR